MTFVNAQHKTVDRRTCLLTRRYRRSMTGLFAEKRDFRNPLQYADHNEVGASSLRHLKRRPTTKSPGGDTEPVRAKINHLVFPQQCPCSCTCTKIRDHESSLRHHFEASPPRSRFYNSQERGPVPPMSSWNPEGGIGKGRYVGQRCKGYEHSLASRSCKCRENPIAQTVADICGTQSATGDLFICSNCFPS